MTGNGIEVADVINRYGSDFRERFGATLSWQQRRVLIDVGACRSAMLGGHLEACEVCGFQRPAYNSCRNRHCPKCQGRARAAWLDARCSDLLPVPYFHVVFTLPDEIGPLALQNPGVVYGLLFRAAADTLKAVAADPKHLGARIGFLAVLHTWGQNLHHHPHVHCVVPGGGLALDNSAWVACHQDFFLPVRVLSRVFRGKFVSCLATAYAEGKLNFHGRLKDQRDPVAFHCWLDGPAGKEWVVYAKPPFGGPNQVLAYLARYTHRVAISNGRILSADDGQIRFRYKDYRAGNQWQTMTLGAVEFIRRFLLHTLPKGFMRIRHYGFLANPVRRARLALCRAFLVVERAVREILAPNQTELKGPTCPECSTGLMVPIRRLPPHQAITPALQPLAAWNTS